jgi:hypothetical protein
MLVSAPSTTAQAWGTLTSEREDLPGGCASRNVHIFISVHCRDLHLCTKTCLGIADGDLAEHIIAVSAKELMGLDLDDDKEISRGRARISLVALSAQPKLETGLDAWGHIDGQLIDLAGASRTAAAAAGTAYDCSASRAGGAGTAHSNEELGLDDLALSIAGAAGLGTSSRACSRAATGLTASLSRNLDIFLAAMNRIEKFELEPKLQVAPSTDPPSSGSTGSTRSTKSEEVAEQISELAEDLFRGMEARCPTHSLQPLVTEAVIGLPFLGIGEHRVGLRCLLEFGFGIWIVRVSVRMILHCELSIGLFDGHVIRIAVDTEYLVVVTGLGHP